MLSTLIKRVPVLPFNKAIPVSTLLFLSAFLTAWATPIFKTLKEPPVLESIVPLEINEWKTKPSLYAQVSVNTFAEKLSDLIYDQVLMRTYEDDAGNLVMLALAYAGEQRQEIKIHQPEVCYPAQGYEMLSIQKYIFNLPEYAHPIQGKRLIFRKDNRMEAVSYWIRLGDSFPMTGIDMRIKILKEGLKGNIDDGVLVRVSTMINQESDANEAFKVQERFLSSFAQSLSKVSPGLVVPQ